eukprot:365910-Chlamydomonas_euryale.AAC.18
MRSSICHVPCGTACRSLAGVGEPSPTFNATDSCSKRGGQPGVAGGGNWNNWKSVERRLKGCSPAISNAYAAAPSASKTLAVLLWMRSRGALYDVVAAGARKFLAECLQGTSVEGGAFRVRPPNAWHACACDETALTCCDVLPTTRRQPIHILVASEMINELQAMFDYFQSSTGFEVVLTGVPYHDVLGELLLSANTAPKAYDAWWVCTFASLRAAQIHERAAQREQSGA